MTSSFPDLKSSSTSDDILSQLNDLKAKLWAAPDLKQLPLVQAIASFGEPGFDVLMEFLHERRSPTLAVGKAYQVLFAANSPKTIEFLQTYFPSGVVPLQSDRNIDYSLLQELLAKQDFQAADQLTLRKLCELAGTAATQRKWIYFTEVDSFSSTDLHTINALWLVHSDGKFGFSVQREIWLSLGRNWERFWESIGWKKGNNWTRYPQEFIWDLSAPRGHLPLSNQLRGVRVIASLLNHPAWSEAKEERGV